MKSLHPPPARYVRTQLWLLLGAPLMLLGVFAYRTAPTLTWLLVIGGIGFFAYGGLSPHWQRSHDPGEQAFRSELRQWLLANYNVQASGKSLNRFTTSLALGMTNLESGSAFQSYGIAARIDDDLRLSTDGRKVSVAVRIEKTGEAALVIERTGYPPALAARDTIRL